MAELKLYIDNEKPIYDEKIKIFKRIYAREGNKKIETKNFKVLKDFSPLIKQSKGYAKRFQEEVSIEDETEALKLLVEEYNNEVIHFKNYDWVK